MKPKLFTLPTIIGLLCCPALACAATREDQSSLVVWGFLGFCALIVVLQLLPALHQWWLALRGSQSRELETQTQPETVRK